jgi:hypothetical protein
MALSTVSDVKSVIGVDMSSADETAITNIFIPAVDATIKNYLGYELEYSSSITETYDGSGEEDFYTAIAPIVSVTSVTEDEVALTEGNQEHFVVYKAQGRIRKTNNKTWSTIRLQNITIVYAAGYSDTESGVEDIPKDIKYISAKAAGKMFVMGAALSAQQPTGEVATHTSDTSSDANFNLVRQESLGDYSATYESIPAMLEKGILNEQDLRVLSKYKRQYFTSAAILD